MITEREIAVLDVESLRLWGLHRRGLYAPVLTEVDELSKRSLISPGVLGLAAWSLAMLDRYDEAHRAVEGALRREPNWAWLHAVSALIQARQESWEAAVRAQVAAVHLMPGEPGHQALLAGYRRQAGQPVEAARAARQALMLDPAHAGALNELGLALAASGDTSRALEQFHLAQVAAAGDPDGYIHEGVLHLRAGARREARLALGAGLQRSPCHAMAENLMAETYVGSTGLTRTATLHLLSLSRVGLVGWLVIAFFCYVLFRLLELLWKAVPATLPLGRGLLVTTLTYLLGGALIGLAVRLAFRSRYRAAIHERTPNSRTNNARKA